MSEKNEKVQIVTEEELMKALDKLEGKEEKKEEAAPAKPEVKVTYLKKTASELVDEKGSEELKKALDVSKTLSEFAALMETHIDESLQAMQKGLEAAANRDLSFSKIVESLKKSIDDLSEQVKKYGEQPTASAAARGVTVPKTAILAKTADGKEERTEVSKKQIREALERLHKSAETPDEKSEIFRKIATYEAAGAIDDTTLAKALDNHRSFYGKKAA